MPDPDPFKQPFSIPFESKAGGFAEDARIPLRNVNGAMVTIA